MEQESGILRTSISSLKKEKLPFVETTFPSLTTIYKHYIFIFDSQKDEGEDCVIFNTQNGTTTQTKTGLNLFRRSNYSFLHWKSNIFVFFQGMIALQQPGPGLFGSIEKREYDTDVRFLNVIERDGQISFEVESCSLKNLELTLQGHFVQVYHDRMYIIRNESSSTEDSFGVHELDLNKKQWSNCHVTGRKIPMSGTFLVNVLFGEKVFFFGESHEARPTEGLFGGGRPKNSSNRVIALDLENMKWKKSYDEIFFPGGTLQPGFHADLVGDKIYLTHPSWDEFIIYDPTNNKFLKSEKLPAAGDWRIKSFENHSTLFQIQQIDGDFWIQYENFGQSVEQQNNDPLVATSQQHPHMTSLWKEKPFTDVTFVIQNEEISAHRVILLKSRYFQNMFNSGMIESKSDKVNVPDISPENFKAILEYIYCDKIDLTESSAIELILEADKYFLPNLKTDCENYLYAKLTVANFVEVMKVVETADSEKLEKKVVSFLTSNIEKVRQEVDIHMIPPELFVKAIIDLKSGKK